MEHKFIFNLTVKEFTDLISGMMDSQMKNIIESLNSRTNPPEIMTMDMLSSYIRLSKSTLYKYVEDGKIPYITLNSKLLFLTKDVDEWLLTYRKNNI